MGGTHKCGLYLQSEGCALPDVLNRAAVIRNEQIRIQIFGSAPDPSKKRSRVTVPSAASQPTRVQPSRAAKCMPSLCDLVEGPFPRRCKVWWAGLSKWQEGVVRG